MPAALAASRTVEPAGTLTDTPSMVRVIILIYGNLLAHFLEMAPNLHFSMQAPHLMHFLGSITCGSLTLPEMEPVGQTRAQSVQPRHFSGSIT